jgi:hypothetical protein
MLINSIKIDQIMKTGQKELKHRPYWAIEDASGQLNKWPLLLNSSNSFASKIGINRQVGSEETVEKSHSHLFG